MTKFSEMFSAACGKQVPCKQKNLTEFYSVFNSYVKSMEFSSSMEKLISDNSFGKQLLVTMVFQIQKSILQNTVEFYGKCRDTKC